MQRHRSIGKKRKHFGSFELSVKQLFAVFVNSVDQENIFCQIDADSLNVHDGRSAQVATVYRLTVALDVGATIPLTKPILTCGHF